MVIGTALYILVPDYPTIQDTTTDLQMGLSNIYHRSGEFLHWLRFQFNLSHHQLIKMNSLSPESKMTKSLQHFVIVWFSSEKCDTSLTTKEGAEYTFGQQFLRKIQNSRSQKKFKMKIQNYRSIKCLTVRVSNQIHVDGMAATLTIWKYKNNLQMLSRRSAVFET